MSVEHQFSPEEKGHLNYLGSMLRKPGTQFDEEVQAIFDRGGVPPRGEGPEQQEKDLQAEGAD